jgi:hypothetical protein
MKIAIIGSHEYRQAMQDWAAQLSIGMGHEVKLPAFDTMPRLNELGILHHNIEIIRWADEVHCFYDNRSIGTVFDFGVCMALEKDFWLIHLDQKTFGNVMGQYHQLCAARMGDHG